MLFEQIPVGWDRNFGYLLGDETSRLAAAVDPGHAPEELLKRAAANNLRIIYVINTHSHFDHSSGNDLLLNETGAELIGYGLKPPARSVADGDVVHLGSVSLTILHTPGHTDDSVCILADDRLITGDTLFVGKVGGTGYGRDASRQYDSLHNRIMTLPDHVRVYPGHDYGSAPESTIGREKKTNPFLVCRSFESFLELKKNWEAYEKKHGLV